MKLATPVATQQVPPHRLSTLSRTASLTVSPTVSRTISLTVATQQVSSAMVNFLLGLQSPAAARSTPGGGVALTTPTATQHAATSVGGVTSHPCAATPGSEVSSPLVSIPPGLQQPTAARSTPGGGMALTTPVTTQQVPVSLTVSPTVSRTASLTVSLTVATQQVPSPLVSIPPGLQQPTAARSTPGGGVTLQATPTATPPSRAAATPTPAPAPAYHLTVC